MYLKVTPINSDAVHGALAGAVCIGEIDRQTSWPLLMQE